MATAATGKRYQSEMRAKTIGGDAALELREAREEIAQIREVLATLMKERRLFIVAPGPIEAKKAPSLEEELEASVEEAKAERAQASGKVEHAGPESWVGRRGYVRVTGVKVLCEVVQEVPGQRRSLLLRRCDNGRLLPRARSISALHPDSRPLSFPPKAKEV